MSLFMPVLGLTMDLNFRVKGRRLHSHCALTYVNPKSSPYLVSPEVCLSAHSSARRAGQNAGVTDTPQPQDGIWHSGRGKESPMEVCSPKGLSPPARVGVRLAPISKTLSWSRTGNLPSGTLGNVSLSGSMSVRYILLSQHFCLLWYALDVGKKNCHVNLCSFV